MTDPATSHLNRPAPLGKRLMVLADYVHPFVYRAQFPQGVPAVDAVLAAGDLPGYYLEFLATKLTVPVIYVHGNHENEFVNEGEGRVAPRGVIPAHGRLVEEAGLRIAGWGGVPRYRQGGHGQYSTSQARWGLRRIGWQGRAGIDVLLTHAPPAGPHSGSDYAHRGCPELTAFITRCRPRLAVHGHIHEYEGRKLEYTDPASGARVVNAYGYHLLDL
ncbi:metallophosphoesterase [Deinococcus taeanensis]|uniref:metallophosphoesterase family protein n=1 Tax=Deinococcus taeanensis TaxID=2737050 RepID=UPI001CDC513C|nr:metallophosphoesterase [Deinococcus taeanensis]UBV42886.1 metallophosphoesterase [Deinococcus taeanensis]